jgi:hypothetical protein
MGGPNKMLADANGQPLVVHAVKAALASQAVEVVVVLGHMADEVRAAIETALPAKSRLRFVTNPDFAEGLSTSVRTGIGRSAAHRRRRRPAGRHAGRRRALLDRLIAAFSPVEGRSICVPTVAASAAIPCCGRGASSRDGQARRRHRRQAPDRRACRPGLRGRDGRRGGDHRHRHARGAGRWRAKGAA